MANITKRSFGTSSKDQPITEYSLENTKGIRISVINYGGIITKIEVPDKKGQLADVTLGYDTLEAYEKDSAYFGALVGRFGNRIANGQFSLNGKTYQLPINNGEHHLHGGPNGFHRQYWVIDADESTNTLHLSYKSKADEEGYPGNLTVNVTYQLTEHNEFIIQYRGSTDKPTIFNPTQHAYFNLSGDMSQSVLDHALSIEAEQVVEINDQFIPTGELVSVQGGPLDFKTVKTIAASIHDPRLKNSLGYDHCYVFNHNGNLKKVATVVEPTSGRKMHVLTTSPGMQFYSGNLLAGTIGKNKNIYPKHGGFCLETQLFPDAPNHSHFSPAVLTPEEDFKATTIYAFEW